MQPRFFLCEERVAWNAKTLKPLKAPYSFSPVSPSVSTTAVAGNFFRKKNYFLAKILLFAKSSLYLHSRKAQSLDGNSVCPGGEIGRHATLRG